MDAEKALSSLGKWSRWQLVMFLIIDVTCCFTAAFHMLGIVFIGLEPEHHCSVPEGLEPNTSIPFSSDGTLDKCHAYENFESTSNSTVACDSWSFPGDVHSIAAEWELVCDKAYLVPLTQTILVAGVVVGAIVCSALSDMFGRKLVFLSSTVAISAVGVITAFTTNYYVFATLRFFTGVLQQGVTLSGFILSCELFPASERTIAGQLLMILWAIGMFVMSLIAYYIRNWSHFLLATSVPGFLAISLFWIIPESMPWLIANGRELEARQILQRAADFNRIELPGEFKISDEEKQSEKKSFVKIVKSKVSSRKSKETEQLSDSVNETAHEGNATVYTAMDIFKSVKLLLFSAIMCYLWCTSGLVYYGLSLSTGELAGDVYLNFFLSGLVEIPAYIIAAIVLQLIGRRFPIATFFLVAGLGLFITMFIPNDMVGPLVAFSMVGKFGIAGAWGAIFLWAPELFPTTLRNVGIGIASVGARVGNIVAPYSSLVAKSMPWLVNVTFGVLSIVAAILCLLLPETLHRPLPQSIHEVEQWSRSLTKEEKERAKEQRRANRERAMEMK